MKIFKLAQMPNIVKLLTVQQFFEGFVPVSALYAIMFQRVGGLSFEQIGLLFSIWSLSYVAAELPSGVLADYWSRRNVIIAGGLLRAIGFAIWIMWPGFWGYAIGFGLWGAMIACTSGSVAAYLHNELHIIGQESRYARYYGWTLSAHSLGMLIGYVIAAALTLKHTNALIGLSIAGSVIFALSLIGAKEHSYKKQDTYFKTLKAGLREVVQSKKLRYVCYGLFSIFMVLGVLEELFPRLYAGFGLSDTGISLILALSLVISVVLLTRLESFVRITLSKQMLLMAAGIVCLVGGIALADFSSFSASALVLLFSLIFYLFRPLFQHHVQAVATGNERATIGSIPGLAGGLLGALAYALIGWEATHSSERMAIASYGVVWLVVILGLAYIGRVYSQPLPTPPST